MNIEQTSWNSTSGWIKVPGKLSSANLALVFGITDPIRQQPGLQSIFQAYPNAEIIGCSTSGEILGTQVYDEHLTVTAIEFYKTNVKSSCIAINNSNDSFQVGQQLAKKLMADDLAHVLVLSDGLVVNGSELVKGLSEQLPRRISVTGGLAGDGDRFESTFILCGSTVSQGNVVAVGFYGENIHFSCASFGGWDSFGPERQITRSENNVLYEMDGKSALMLYKEYLGESSAGLPATAMLFPLSVRENETDRPVVRTVLAMDEEEQSLTFAGDIPEGSYARLMKTNLDRLVDGALDAAKISKEAMTAKNAELAILISCVGRKLVLQQQTEEEIEAVRKILGDHVLFTGFYSYGEISPFVPSAKCELHNQTMTITILSET